MTPLPCGRLKAISAASVLMIVLSSCTGSESASDSASEVKVPDVTGIRYSKARAELQELGLDVRRKTVAAAEPVNTVVEQSIRPGQSVDQGAVIRLTVSDGTLSTSQSGTFADVFEQVSDGVMRIETTACDSGGHGTGFLIAPDLIMTVGHVVDGAVSIAISGAKDVSAGDVIGIDPENDLALVRSETDFDGHVFEFASDTPPAGTDVAVIGYPEDEALSITEGSISGLDRVIDVEGVGRIDGAIQTDAAINPGNSGGPLVDMQGAVIGLADAVRPDSQGIAFAVSGDLARAESSGWAVDPQMPDVPTCAAPVGPGSQTVLSDVAHPDLQGLLDTFQSYFDGINLGLYRQAYDQSSSERRSQVSFAGFRAGTLTSYDFDVRIRSIDDVDPDTRRVLVTFWSVQEPKYGQDGQGCTKWTLDYTMVLSGDRWLIDSAQEHGDDGSVAC
jgi:serine protease Do